MKPIKLTEEHESKLLEMCKTLFPEQNWHFWEPGEESYPDGMLGYSNYAILEKHKTIQSGLEIHWFEFCMTHLAPKICDCKTYYIFCDRCNSHKIDSTEFSKEFTSKYLQHPVDYLYEEFKKLKS